MDAVIVVLVIAALNLVQALDRRAGRDRISSGSQSTHAHRHR